MAKIEQPKIDLQKELDDILNAKPEEVTINNKTYTINWMRNATSRKISSIVVNEDNEWKRNVKVCAAILCNSSLGIVNALKLIFWFPIYWRYLYYIQDLDMVDVLAVLDVAKKKLQLNAFVLVTILVTEMNDLMMTMTRKEVKRFQAEQGGERPTH